MGTLCSLVTTAQRDDLDAFGMIVERFQDMAYASAYALLGDFHLAQDAAQEAFIDAYLSLPKLREPVAFPGWFRRIVFKHSDRLIRSKHLATAPLEAAAVIPSAELGPAAAVEAHEMQELIRQAIETLPENERLVTALFYIKDYSHKEIADFLELPVTTVKKRLHDARKHLKKRITDMVRDYLQETRPSQDTRLSNAVQFFIAVRANDIHRVKTLLKSDPGLANAKEEWDETAQRQYYFPMGREYTPLHRAAMDGHKALVELLLVNKADVNAKNYWGETPLHRAVLGNQQEVATLLLAHGAEVNATTSSGMTPLHWATNRGHKEVVELLLANAVDVNAKDKSGWTPLDWALKNGHTAIAVLLRQHRTQASTASA